jgi:hypothetical protein
MGSTTDSPSGGDFKVVGIRVICLRSNDVKDAKTRVLHADQLRLTGLSFMVKEPDQIDS